MYKNNFSDLQLLRMAFILWVAYFFLLALLQSVVHPHGTEIVIYYAIHGINGFMVLVLTWLPWKPLWLERVIVPVTFVLMASLPTLTHHIIIGLVFNREIGPFDVVMWSLTPVHLIGLLLTAWRYQWQHVVIFSLATAGLNLIGLFIPPEINFSFPPPPSPRPPRPLPIHYSLIPALGIQTLSFLIIGYFTSALNNRLRAQEHALSKANAELRAQARTEEELTISQERNRMARELHDTLARTLTGLSVQLQTVKAYWDVEPETSQEMLDEAVVATRSGLQEVRQALKALRAAPLEDLGLSLAIREVAESVAERGKLDLRLSITEPLPSFAPEVSQCLYRVAQEAMMNVLYHANAKRLSVLLQVKDDGVQLTIEDDGIGFDDKGQYTGHWGVQGIRERAELVGGHLLLKSQLDHGTTIELYIPKDST